MITCSVCGQQNDGLAVLCVSCHSFIQSKVDNLDLFQTVWQLVENPRAAFKKIVLARHKNYVMVLSSLLGVSMTFALCWLMNLGNQFENLLTLTGTAGLLGIPLGIVFVLLLSVVVTSAVRLLGGRASLRDCGAVVAYAGTPIVLSLVAVLPLEIAIFGIDFFGTNPPPVVISPSAYIGLLGFDALATLWTVLLLYKGVSVMSGFGKAKSLAVTLMAVLVPVVLFIGTKVLYVL
jgi:hypothetical protein